MAAQPSAPKDSVSSMAKPSAPDEGLPDDWAYGGGRLLLAPMVRVNSLAFRTLCAEHGAAMLYSEEIVDKSLAECRRTENSALGTVDFESPGDRGGGRVATVEQHPARCAPRAAAARCVTLSCVTQAASRAAPPYTCTTVGSDSTSKC